MDIYELDRDEAIILQSGNVTRDGYDESEFEDEELHELVLTNKHLIYIVSDIDGEDEDVIKVPLSAVKVIGGKVQVKEMNHELYGRCLQVQFKHGIEYWKFGRKGKQMIPQWTDALSNAILEVPMPSATANSQRKSASSKKATTTSGISGFASAMKSVKDAATNAASSVRKQAEIDEDDDYTAEDNEPIVQLVHKGGFCASCGATLNAGSKFCHECGAAVGAEKPKTTKRETVYEGNLHKCPSCGETVKSFDIACPSCGHEFRDSSASASVSAFAEKMEQLQRNGRRADKDNIISHIRTFPIPNTKEDLFEFVILAGSNIREDRYSDELPKYQQEISDAWKSKFEQAYRKAKLSFKGDKSFREIESLYREKMGEQKQAKRRSNLLIALPIIGLILFNVIGWGGIFLSDHIKIEKETERLEAIVEEVYEYIEQEQYVLARSKVSTLVFSGSTTQAGDQAAAKWDITRQQLLDIIDRAEYGADYTPGIHEIRIGADQEDMKGDDYLDVKKQLENRGFTNIKTEPVADLTTGWWTSEGSVESVSVGGDVVFSEDSTYSSNVEIIIYYHALKSNVSDNDGDYTPNENTTNPATVDPTDSATLPVDPEETTVPSIAASIEKGAQYTYGHDEWSLYCATALSDTLIKIEKWGKTLSSEKTFDLEYEVGAIRINDAEYGFSWIDDSHTAFVIQLQDEQDSDFKKPQTITFTISGTDSDTNKGTNYTKDGICYSYQNDDWHLYRAIPLTDTVIKIECWYRSLAFGSFNYGYDVVVIDLNNTEMDFEWTDNEHTAFTISMQDKQNSNLKKATFAAFTLDE